MNKLLLRGPYVRKGSRRKQFYGLFAVFVVSLNVWQVPKKKREKINILQMTKRTASVLTSLIIKVDYGGGSHSPPPRSCPRRHI